MNELADKQGDDGGLRELALFAGIGGGILGGHLLGWRTICAVERDAYAAQVLAQRQNDGILPPFPIWSDVCSFDGRPWRGIVDVISGGFPCQDVSIAGAGKGLDGDRSGLWREMGRIIGEVRPGLVYLENSTMLVGRGLAIILGDLAEMGYDAQWCIVSASDAGAPHKRDRIWIVAKNVADTRSKHEQRFVSRLADQEVRARSVERQVGSRGYGFRRWPAEPGMGRVDDGCSFKVDRLKALGNGQVPRVAAAAFNILTS